VLWKKDKIKKEYGFSPDDGDALVLTFAEPVHKEDDNFEIAPNIGGWMSA
jgi:hypothetical protein